MDRMAAVMGAFTCIRSDPVEPVDPEKALCRERSTKRTFTSYTYCIGPRETVLFS